MLAFPCTCSFPHVSIPRRWLLIVDWHAACIWPWRRGFSVPVHCAYSPISKESETTTVVDRAWHFLRFLLAFPFRRCPFACLNLGTMHSSIGRYQISSPVVPTRYTHSLLTMEERNSCVCRVGQRRRVRVAKRRVVERVGEAVLYDAAEGSSSVCPSEVG